MRFLSKKSVLAFFLILILAISFAVTSLADDGIVSNGDFSNGTSGWSIKKWIIAEANVGVLDKVLFIEHSEFNDTRLSQEIYISAQTMYRVSAEIKIDDIQSESAEGYAWIGFADTYARAYVNAQSDDWQKVEFFAMSDDNQSSAVLQLGFGDHGKLVLGSCEFRNIEVQQNDNPEEAQVFSLNNIGDNNPKTDTRIKSMLEISQVLSKILWAFLCFVFVFAVFNWGKRRPRMFDRFDESNIAFYVLILALVVRVIIILFSKGYPVDTRTFLSWGQRLVDVGPAQFYSAEYFCDYPPGVISLLGVGVKIVNLLKIPLKATGPSLMIVFLPILIADVAISYTVWKYAKKRLNSGMSLAILIVLAFHPVFIHNSAIWHQVDTLMTLLLVLSFIFIEKKKYYTAAFLYGVAVIMKPQALMFGPLFALPYLRQIFVKGKKIKGVRNLLISAIIAFVTIIIISLPFKGNQAFWPFTGAIDNFQGAFSDKIKLIIDNNWLIDKYYSTAAASYPYASVNAYNFYALLGANYVPESTMLGPFAYSTYASVALVIIIIAVIVFYIFSQKNKIDANFLLAAFLIFALFMFGPRMHERYALPVLAFLALAYAKNKDKGILAAFAMISSGILANVTITLMVLNDMDMYYTAALSYGVQFVSAFNLLSFIYLFIVVYDVCVKGRIQKSKSAMNIKKFDAGELSEKKPYVFEARKPSLNSKSREREVLECRIKKRKHIVDWSKLDYIVVLIIMALYGVFSMFRLGDASAPESYWRGKNGQQIEIDFGDEKNIRQIWHFTGISEGKIKLMTKSAAESRMLVGAVGTAITPMVPEEFASAILDAESGVMYRWQANECEITAEKIILECVDECWINEIVFLDENGKVLSPTSVVEIKNDADSVEDWQSSINHIFDESALKPDRPSMLNGMYFDEIYHARTAYEHLQGLQPYETTHPPLGKLFIAAGIKAFGMNPFGWRIAGNVFGILMIPVFYALAKRLLKKTNYAIVGTLLFTFDFMHFVQSRIATIDVFGVFFILAMYYFMLKYWQMNSYRDGLRATLVPLSLSGLCFGLGMACKWIDIYAGLGLAVLFFASIYMRYEEHKLAKIDFKRTKNTEYIELTKPFAKNTLITICFCLVFFVLVPIAIYALSYIPYFHVNGKNTYTLNNILEAQKGMFGYHSQLTARHGYESSWWTWPLDLRPIFFYSGKGLSQGFGAVISSFGNPIVWWLGLLSLIAVIFRSFSRKKLDSISAFIIIGFAAQFLPWTIVTRATFIYHYFASLPFIILAILYIFMLWNKKNKYANSILYACTFIAIALFALYYPAISGLPVPRAYLEMLKLLPTWTW